MHSLVLLDISIESLIGFQTNIIISKIIVIHLYKFQLKNINIKNYVHKIK
jgi:hypothetical protein